MNSTERALREAVRVDPSERAMEVLVDYWAEHGHKEWADRTRVFAFERPKRCQILFARVPGSPPSPRAEAELQRRLDASEALFFGQPLEAVTARFEVSWRTGRCRFDQDMRLRLDGSYGIDWLHPSPHIDWLGRGAGIPLDLPQDRALIDTLQMLATRWVSAGCPGHPQESESWFDDWGTEGWVEFGA